MNTLGGMSVTDWPTNRVEYDLIKVLGRGATAIVYKAFCKTNNRICAIKRINVKTEKKREDALKEIQAITACNHDNIIKYYTSFEISNEIWLLTNISEGGSLFDIINLKMSKEDCSDGVFNEVTIATVLKEVLKGLEYLHSNGLIHRDIKDQNILFSKDGSVQIADLGLCTQLLTSGNLARLRTKKESVGTLCWMAPEARENHNGYNFKVDVWSFGMLAVEMITGSLEYKGFHPENQYLGNYSFRRDTFCNEKYKKYGNLLRKMIAKCLQKDPSMRPTATELLNHTFFEKAKGSDFLKAQLLKWEAMREEIP